MGGSVNSKYLSNYTSNLGQLPGANNDQTNLSLLDNLRLRNTPGQVNPYNSNTDQSQLNDYQRMFETGKGYGTANDKPAVAYKAFVETNGRPPTYGELGGALNTAATGLDSYALSGSRPLLEAEGQRQYDQANDFINSDARARDASRAKMGDLLTQQAKDTFARTLPDIAENSQAAHLYDSTGYGQEVARQQGALASGIASQIGQLGTQDIQQQSAQRQAALQGLQGFETGGLQRYTGLQDYATQAALAKQLGQAAVPSVGKGGGTGALKGGAMGAAAGAPFGPWGAGIGGALGAVTGGVSPSSGGK